MWRFITIFVVAVLSVRCEESNYDGIYKLKTSIDIEEGQSLSLKCNAIGSIVFWNRAGNFYKAGRQLSFFNITRNYTDIYTCISYGDGANESRRLGGIVDTVFINVIYPAKILRASVVSNSTLSVNETFELEVDVEGNPPPQTTLKSAEHGREVFRGDGEGRFNITMAHVQCDDTGTYILMVSNTLYNSTHHQIRTESISVLCPPGPVRNLTASDITTHSAKVSWLSGYDYGAKQTFSLLRCNSSACSDFRSYPEIPGSHGMQTEYHVIDQLDSATLYNISVMATSFQGNSTPSNAVQFITYGVPRPDPNYPVNKTFHPRLGDSVTMTMVCQGYPCPRFTWMHGDRQLVNHSDTCITTSLTIVGVRVLDFGVYTLKAQNLVGNATFEYEIKASGPPDPVGNLRVNDVRTSSVNMSWYSGFDYGDAETFVLLNCNGTNCADLRSYPETPDSHGLQTEYHVIDQLDSATLYNISVMATSSQGNSTPSNAVQFTTYGAPSQDPSYYINKTIYPRLGDTVTMEMRSQGYPCPNYTWWYEGRRLSNHHDDGYLTTLTLESVRVQDYGVYTLVMENIIGNASFEYEVNATGPPDPVTLFQVGSVTSYSFNASWFCGFNYGSRQWFQLLNCGLTGSCAVLRTYNETGNQHGLHTTNHVIDGMSHGTRYNLTMLAINERGPAANYSNLVTFTTKGDPNTDPHTSHSHAAVIGSTVGGAALFILVLLVAYLFCRRRRSQTQYQQMDDSQITQNIIQQ